MDEVYTSNFSFDFIVTGSKEKTLQGGLVVLENKTIRPPTGVGAWSELVLS